MTNDSDVGRIAAALTERLQHMISAQSKNIKDVEARRRQLQAQFAEAGQRSTQDHEQLKSLKAVLANLDTLVVTITNNRASVQSALDRVREGSVDLPDEPSASGEAVDRARAEVTHELRRVGRVFAELRLDFHLTPGISPDGLRLVEHVIEARLDDHLKAFWELTDGSAYQAWFAEGMEDDGPGDFTPYYFLSMDVALSNWDPVSENVDEEDYDDLDDVGERAPQIQPDYLHHRLWFPFGESAGGNQIRFDAAPTAAGRYGQIIEFVHDPDTIYLAADSFMDFFRRSNRILENSLKADAAALRTWLHG
jgi:cell wall assembly regulator SMI1